MNREAPPRHNGNGLWATIDLNNILQLVILATIIWFGTRVVTMSEIQAVHEWRITNLEQEYNHSGVQNGNNRNGEGKGPGIAVGTLRAD